MRDNAHHALAEALRTYVDTTAIAVIFLGIVLTGAGSSYYHWSPNDDTLFWDRLPMALAFMAILANAVEERVNARAGAVLLWPLLAIGVFSLLLWRWNDDLRLYGWVQFFPCLALPLMFLLLPPKYTGTSYWIVAAALYALYPASLEADPRVQRFVDFLAANIVPALGVTGE